MNDATRRGLRTALQMVVTLLTTGGVVGLIQAAGIDITVQQWALISALALPPVTTALNWLEDNDTIPALLKAPASPGRHPVPKHSGDPVI